MVPSMQRRLDRAVRVVTTPRGNRTDRDKPGARREVWECRLGEQHHGQHVGLEVVGPPLADGSQVAAFAARSATGTVDEHLDFVEGLRGGRDVLGVRKVASYVTSAGGTGNLGEFVGAPAEDQNAVAGSSKRFGNGASHSGTPAADNDASGVRHETCSPFSCTPIYALRDMRGVQALGTLEIVVRIERRQGGEWAIVSGPDATPYPAPEANERHTGQSSSGVNAGSAERRQAAAAYTADVPPDRWPGSTRVPSPIPVTDKE